jgi:hypothetical protein
VGSRELSRRRYRSHDREPSTQALPRSTGGPPRPFRARTRAARSRPVACVHTPVALVSHELRNLLSTIIACTEMLQADPALSGDPRDLVSVRDV